MLTVHFHHSSSFSWIINACWGITYFATGPAASEPMKALEAPSSDSTVQELEAFPPLCHRWDKHLQTQSRRHCVISYFNEYNLKNEIL